MAGLTLKADGETHYLPLKRQEITGYKELEGVMIPLHFPVCLAADFRRAVEASAAGGCHSGLSEPAPGLMPAGAVFADDYILPGQPVLLHFGDEGSERLIAGGFRQADFKPCGCFVKLIAVFPQHIGITGFKVDFF